MLNKTKNISDIKILNFYLSNSKGIKGTASYLGVSKVRVGKIVNRFLNKKITFYN